MIIGLGIIELEVWGVAEIVKTEISGLSECGMGLLECSVRLGSVQVFQERTRKKGWSSKLVHRLEEAYLVGNWRGGVGGSWDGVGC